MTDTCTNMNSNIGKRTAIKRERERERERERNKLNYYEFFREVRPIVQNLVHFRRTRVSSTC